MLERLVSASAAFLGVYRLTWAVKPSFFTLLLAGSAF
jgi:hypothetical protein